MRSRVLKVLLISLLLGLHACSWEMYRQHPPDIKGDWQTPHLKQLYAACVQEKALDVSLCVASKVNPWANIQYERAK